MRLPTGRVVTDPKGHRYEVAGFNDRIAGAPALYSLKPLSGRRSRKPIVATAKDVHEKWAVS